MKQLLMSIMTLSMVLTCCFFNIQPVNAVSSARYAGLAKPAKKSTAGLAYAEAIRTGKIKFTNYYQLADINGDGVKEMLLSYYNKLKIYTFKNGYAKQFLKHDYCSHIVYDDEKNVFLDAGEYGAP